ncbi:MAG: class B sortase [Eubacterium sp.]|jgi:sortase B|nr:class B sortase [Eubacterium sp.]
MAIATHYNSRPIGRGRKKSLLARLLGGIFPIRGDSGGEVIRKLIFLAALVSFVYFGGSVALELGGDMIQQWKIDEYNRRMADALNLPPEMEESVRKKVPEILPEFIAGYNDNNDLVGHVRIDDQTAPGNYLINYPVYQSDDNEYYLKHAFDHSDSVGGSIFADYRNNFSAGEISANTVLYGHNMINQEYFTLLSRYHPNYYLIGSPDQCLDFYKKHPIVEFNTIYEKSKWKIFACGLYNTQKIYGEVYEYNNQLEFYNEDEFNNFILDVMDRSVLFTDVDLKYGDNILTLSTCFYPMGKEVDTRCVVFARKIREGEIENVNVNKAVYNDREYRFEKQAYNYGTNWNGRVWDTSYLKS